MCASDTREECVEECHLRSPHHTAQLKSVRGAKLNGAGHTVSQRCYTSSHRLDTSHIFGGNAPSSVTMKPSTNEGII